MKHFVLMFLCGFWVSTQSNAITLNSWQDLKFDGIVSQELDYSCGSASIVTILNEYLMDNWSENLVITDMTARLTEEEMKSRILEGFSMLDMKKTLVRLGYQVAGVKLTIAQLKKLTGPVIILLRKEEINHFVVLRGVVNEEVYIADPSLGKVRMSLEQLNKEWQGEVLAIGKLGDNSINRGKMFVKESEIGHPELEAVRGWRFFRPGYPQ